MDQWKGSEERVTHDNAVQDPKEEIADRAYRLRPSWCTSIEQDSV